MPESSRYFLARNSRQRLASYASALQPASCRPEQLVRLQSVEPGCDSHNEGKPYRTPLGARAVGDCARKPFDREQTKVTAVRVVETTARIALHAVRGRKSLIARGTAAIGGVPKHLYNVTLA